MFRDRAQRLHFVGIGGIGMSGIAEVLRNMGYDVQGSDLCASQVTARLERMGVRIMLGHDAAHVGEADVVVTSSAVAKDNPEVVAARQAGVPVIPRAEMLAELMRLKYAVTVAGSHGKTTTTSLLATILQHAQLDPTVVIGGRLKSLDSNARLGAGEYMVAEADESDGSFLRLQPTIAVITNIDPEHLDYWQGGLEQICDGFVRFANKVPFYGVTVACLDHPNVQAILPRLEKRVLTYGLSPQADVVASRLRNLNGQMHFEVSLMGELQGTVALNMIGKHNVLNALAAMAVAHEVGVPFACMQEALAAFAGVGRRFEIKGEHNGVLVVDDYGHHPAEISATLQAARDAYGRRLVVVFQPHRYSRTRDLLSDFATSFNASNTVLVTDIYAASEQPLPGVTSEALVAEISAHGHHDVRYVASLDGADAALEELVQPGDLVLTLGAGDVWRVGERLVARLQTADTAAATDQAAAQRAAG